MRLSGAALAALEAAGLRHCIVATSGSLSGLRAAVRSGIALTLRTARWMGEDLVDVTAALALPAVPEAEFGIRLRRDAEPAAGDFAEMLCDEIGAVRERVMRRTRDRSSEIELVRCFPAKESPCSPSRSVILRCEPR